MCILVDFNQIVIANLLTSIGNHYNIDVNEDLIRHMVLNSLRKNRKKFKDQYGEMIICADGRNSWRKKVFPYYKASRRKTREESELDWNELFRVINTIRQELDEYFPYKVIHIDSCEADDVIGTISHLKGVELGDGEERILILSSDKDYIQLQKYSNIDQYDPVRDRWIKTADPVLFLQEHILKGDTGDGIPNVLSPDNCIVIGERQKPLTAKRKAALLEEITDETTKIRYSRNKLLIDLSQIPDEQKQEILAKYNTPKTIGRTKLYSFFVEKQLTNLISELQDF